jgi:hypothetical protein
MPPHLWNPGRFWHWLLRKSDEPHQTAAPPISLDDPLSDLSLIENSRFSPCSILYEAGVPCVIWGEDALTAYDIPTITTPSPRFYDSPQMSVNVPRLAQIPASAVHDMGDLPKADDVNAPGVILLPAKYWRYKLPQTVDEINNFIPQMPTPSLTSGLIFLTVIYY